MVGVTGADNNGQPKGLISVKPNLDFVFSRRKIKPLRETVEVVDDASVRLVHVNLNILPGFLRVDFDPHGSAIGVSVRPITIRAVTPITVPITVPVTMAVAMAVVTMRVAIAVVTMPIAMPVVVLRIGIGRK